MQWQWLFAFFLNLKLFWFVGNPWPAVIQDPGDNSKWIHNVLLDSARRNLGAKPVEEAVTHDRSVDENTLDETSDKVTDSNKESGTEV